MLLSLARSLAILAAIGLRIQLSYGRLQGNTKRQPDTPHEQDNCAKRPTAWLFDSCFTRYREIRISTPEGSRSNRMWGARGVVPDGIAPLKLLKEILATLGLKMTANDDVLIGFTKWVLKWIAIVVGGLAGTALLAVGGYLAWQWLTVWRHESNIQLVIQNGLTATKESRHCESNEFSTFVGYVNKSARTIEYVTIEVTARLPERSTEILNYITVSFDDIVKPEGGMGQCYSFAVKPEFASNPKLPQAIYRGEIVTVRFSIDEPSS